MNIKPGSNIKVEIKSLPKAAAGVKTLMRLCSRDLEIQRINRKRKASRPSHESWTRGGAVWNHRMRSESAAVIAPGEKFNLRATLDVLRDLKSVESHVAIQSA